MMNDRWAWGKRTLLVTVVAAMVEPLVNARPFTVQVAIDLPALLLEMPGLAIPSLVGGTNRLVVKFLLYAIPLDIKMFFDALSLLGVAVLGPGRPARISQGRRCKAEEHESQNDRNDSIHGLVLSPGRVTQCFCWLRRMSGEMVYQGDFAGRRTLATTDAAS